MGVLTTHVLDLVGGMPAAGMRIELHSLSEAGSKPLAALRTNADGRCPNPVLQAEAMRRGRYELRFHVAEYFRALGTALPDPPFLDEVVIAFGIADAAQNYHVPLLVSPWAYSTYRGS